ncbi:orotate phosphoribosyltransferase [Oceanobacillus sp. FSL H7-0719]|uniref:orotate phosphoribosyltransferase n=1 Tax=Oceanobacillus sp. FSL H7-0719 TaxID=2954507 RepID=UPI003253C65E
MAIEQEIIRDLLKIEAVQLNPENYFIWTSGIKSPIYCDNRLIMSFPELRKKIIKGFISMIKEKNLMPDVIAGCATAGIPHAAWLSAELDLPMVYVRSKPKAHGKGNQVEGQLQQGQRVLVIEDLISTGGSSIDAAQALQEAGANVVGVLAIFSYGLKQAEDNFNNAGHRFATITDFDNLLNELEIKNEITANEKYEMLAWREELVQSIK